MATTQIFPHQNNQALNVTYYNGMAGYVGGMCCGYSIAWARLFLLRKPIDTVPKEVTARALTTVMSSLADNQNNSTIEMVANTAAFHHLREIDRSALDVGWGLFLARAPLVNGVYLFCTGNHVVAVGRYTDEYYYFDPNYGLYRCDDWNDLFFHLLGEPNIAGWLNNPQSFMLQYNAR